MVGPLFIMCLGVAATLSYAYIRQLIYNKRQRQRQNQHRQDNSVLIVGGIRNSESATQQIPPKYEDITDIQEPPPNYDQVVVTI